MRGVSRLLPFLRRRRRALIRDDATLFRRARLQLTAWYALTLMVIVLSFSAVLYGVLAARLSGHHREAAELASERAVERDSANFALDELRVYLVLGNVSLLVLGVAGAYLLAGRTLRPIAETMSRQKRFAADASHELRTPLTVMRGNIDVALLRKRPAAEYRAVLEEANADLTSLTVLVEQLLQLARGTATLQGVADVDAVLNESVAGVRDLAEHRGSTVQSAVPAGLIVHVDAASLHHIVDNLVINALRHTPPGTTVRVEGERHDKTIAITVRDNGPGIPPEERDRIFEPFYRLQPAATDGAGLGLALVRELVTANGGGVWIEDATGGGASFRVELPAG